MGIYSLEVINKFENKMYLLQIYSLMNIANFMNENLNIVLEKLSQS